MRKITALAGLVLILAAASFTQSPASPLVQDQFLREELALARTPSLYFVILLKSRLISLRAGGVTLREWKIAGLRFWGTAPRLAALTLEKKSTLFPPKRKEIVPTLEEQAPEEKPAGEEEKNKSNKEQKKEEQASQSFELDALELKDMPSTFIFFLSDGSRVYFRPSAHKFFPLIASFGHSLSWYLWVPLKNLAFRLRKRPFSAIDIRLDTGEDAQSMYWAIPDGTKGLIFPL
jgi:hypothetical protein